MRTVPWFKYAIFERVPVLGPLISRVGKLKIQEKQWVFGSLRLKALNAGMVSARSQGSLAYNRLGRDPCAKWLLVEGTANLPLISASQTAKNGGQFAVRLFKVVNIIYSYINKIKEIKLI